MCRRKGEREGEGERGGEGERKREGERERGREREREREREGGREGGREREGEGEGERKRERGGLVCAALSACVYSDWVLYTVRLSLSQIIFSPLLADHPAGTSANR